MEILSENTPLVSVCTLAYNHAPYIRECLDGILMQKTNFAFELLIHDDASTDGTADIIREYEAKYPDIVKPIYQTENQYSKRVGISTTYQYPRVKGKYIAMCEGDDYWTDPLKLQKQVDFMEANLQIPCCFHMIDIYQQNSGKFEKTFIPSFLKDKDEDDGEFFTNFDRLEGWFAYILSIMFRSEHLDYLKDKRKKYKVVFNDNHLIYYLIKDSKSYLFKKSMAVYRMNDTGIFGNKTKEFKYSRIYEIINEMYEVEPDEFNRGQFIWCIKEILKFYIKRGDWKAALEWKKRHLNEVKKSDIAIITRSLKYKLINKFKG